jgi:cytochrome c peroxidase
MRTAILLALAPALALVPSACAVDTTPPTAAAYEWSLPAGFPIPDVPADNPMTTEKVELGRRLFFDTRLSADGTQSCASCHDPSRAFTDGRPVPIGVTGEPGRHNAMTLINVAYNSAQTWTADVADLEDQALRPMLGTDPIELGLSGHEAEVLARFSTEELNGDEVSLLTITRALASYERTLISGDTPFDRFVRGDKRAMTDAAQRGFALFESLGCAQCHTGFTLSSVFGEPRTFNTGVGNGKFKAPTLRNITKTAPYFHDGSATTLDEVIDHYATASGPDLSPLIKPFSLTTSERADLLAYLASLTD